MKTLLLRLAVSAACFSLVTTVLPRPRPPLPPYPELTLASWRFDNPDTVTAGAIVATNLWLAEGWSGYALDMAAQDTRLLLVPAVAGPNDTNFNRGSGTIRMWLAPTTWASASAGGAGPGDWAVLFQLTQTNTVEHPFDLAVAIDPAGTNLIAALTTETGTVVLVQNPISWSTGTWHQVAFVYWSNSVALVVDDTQEHAASVAITWPSGSVWQQSAFSLGGSATGVPGQAQYDEISTFGFPLSTNYLTWSYQAFSSTAALGPIPDLEFGGGAETMSAPSPCDPCPSPGTNDPPPEYSSPGWATNGLRFEPVPYFLNATNRTNSVMLLAGTTANTAYEIYKTTNLLSVPTNIVWAFATNGATNQVLFTNVVTTNITDAYYLAASYEDYDQNSVSDAYQWLVQRLSARMDSDGDSLPDGYESTHGTSVTNRDTDADGIWDNALTLSFTITNGSTGVVVPKGTLMRGRGFHVWAKDPPHPSETFGVLNFYFQQNYRGMDLNVYSGDGNPTTYERGIVYNLPNLTNAMLKFLVKYDFRSIRFSVSNANTLLYTNVYWMDNMTETLGTNGPTTLWITNATWFTNASYAPAPYGRTNGPVWEGVIGNTSQMQSGPSVHAPWWPIKWMVSKGTNVFYSCGFNESKFDIQKFHTANPQFVVSNLSADLDDPRVRVGDRYPINMALNGTTLYVLYASNSIYHTNHVVTFDLDTCEKLNDALSPSLFPNITTGLQIPLANSVSVAVHPETSDIAAVYYHTTDQVVVYTNASLSTWNTNFVIGRKHGYSNGPAILLPTNTAAFRSNVQFGCYYFDSTNHPVFFYPVPFRVTNVALCFQTDGKLWVGDTPTSRMLRFDTNGLCDSWFMFVAHSYTASVDRNDPKRVFMGYLEFEVDYAKPISSSWALKNYWGKHAATPRNDIERRGLDSGLWEVTTLPTGTYALVIDPFIPNPGIKRVVELTSTGLRLTSATNISQFAQLEADGSYWLPTMQPDETTGTNVVLTRYYISSWAGADPVYSTQIVGNVRYTNNVHPVYWTGVKTNGNIAFLFYPEKNQYPGGPYTGYHLGAATLETNGTWLWLRSPTGSLDGLGTFDACASCDYAATRHVVIGGHIFYSFRGEAWRGGQANQIMHFNTNGLFQSQFGMPRNEQNIFARAGAAGSLETLSGFKTNNTIYLYTADEWSHGVHRWRIDVP